jgi:hypothetical protein
LIASGPRQADDDVFRPIRPTKLHRVEAARYDESCKQAVRVPTISPTAPRTTCCSVKRIATRSLAMKRRTRSLAAPARIPSSMSTTTKDSRLECSHSI